jgi:hypothetical protein
MKLIFDGKLILEGIPSSLREKDIGTRWHPSTGLLWNSGQMSIFSGFSSSDAFGNYAPP